MSEQAKLKRLCDNCDWPSYRFRYLAIFSRMGARVGRIHVCQACYEEQAVKPDTVKVDVERPSEGKAP